jgi:hypothetical protein
MGKYKILGGYLVRGQATSATISSGKALGRARSGARPTLARDDKYFYTYAAYVWPVGIIDCEDFFKKRKYTCCYLLGCVSWANFPMTLSLVLLSSVRVTEPERQRLNEKLCLWRRDLGRPIAGWELAAGDGAAAPLNSWMSQPSAT